MAIDEEIGWFHVTVKDAKSPQVAQPISYRAERNVGLAKVRYHTMTIHGAERNHVRFVLV